MVKLEKLGLRLGLVLTWCRGGWLHRLFKGEGQVLIVCMGGYMQGCSNLLLLEPREQK